MKQIYSSANGRGVFETPAPVPGDNELLVAVSASVISTGTETMEMKKDNLSLIEQLAEKKLLMDKVSKIIREKGINRALKVIRGKLSPSERSILFKPVGYSNAGYVIAKGRLVKNFNVGDRVACAGAGIASHTEYTAVPVNLAVKIPADVSLEAAGFTTIGAIAMQGIRRASVTFGETVVITGLGLLGLIAVQIAKAWGLVVIGIDLNPKRLELAKELGADHCFDAKAPNLIDEVLQLTHGHGADAVIIYAATKHSGPVNQAFDACRKKGRVVAVGSVGMELNRDLMYAKELDFVISTSYGPGRYDNQYELKGIDYPIGYVRWTENRNMMEFIRLLSTGQVKVDRLISGKFPINEVDQAYKSLVENPDTNIASVFNYFHEENIAADKRLVLHNRRIPEGKTGVGIIGAGAFVQRNHLANILKMPDDYELIAIAEKTSSSAKTASGKYSLKYVTTDYNELLSDPEIDLIVIGTRHNLHARLVSDSIRSGKNVLVEKPLAMSHEELELIEEAIRENPGVIATVGFNRRYSPLTQRVKRIIEKSKTPVVINYRVNAGFIPPDNWVQDLEEGGGRIIGEVCHFIDLIAYVAAGIVKEIHAVHVPITANVVPSEDNIIISMTFDNGSIGVLTYTSLGSSVMEKERIEVFLDGSSMVIRDFIELKTYGCGEAGIILKSFDKGHRALINELSKKLKNEESLILPFETDIEMTRLTLSVVDQIHGLQESEF